MLLWILAYVGGLLTILSPCILPVLPFVFARSGQPFAKSGLPLLLGMTLTFTAFGLLGVVGGAWVVGANQWGRWLALALLGFFGLSLLFPHTLESLLAPLARLGGKLSVPTAGEGGVGQSFVLGIATGLLWAPCAGPILGLILTGAATAGGSVHVFVLLLAYALGAGTSLMFALVAGGKFLGAMKKYLRAERIIKGVLGVAVILGVLSVAFGWDRTILTRLSRVQTEGIETRLIRRFSKSEASGAPTDALSSLTSATAWLNSPPLTVDSLRGKVVLIDFWTYSCINCIRTLPYIRAWAEKYSAKGLVVIGVHSPEFAFERDVGNIAAAVKELGVTYPVAIDNDFAIWKAFRNEYWPAHYFIDRKGVVRHTQFGEGSYAESEKILRELLSEDGTRIDGDLAKPMGLAAEAPAALLDSDSPETYLGYERAENLVVSPAVKPDRETAYEPGKNLRVDQWGVSGVWKFSEESATLARAHGKIRFRFRARDLHLVLGPGKTTGGVRYRVTLDGKPLGESHGIDTDSDGAGIVREHRLYQLIRQTPSSTPGEHLFEIEFLDSGVEAFAFTFG